MEGGGDWALGTTSKYSGGGADMGPSSPASTSSLLLLLSKSTNAKKDAGG